MHEIDQNIAIAVLMGEVAPADGYCTAAITHKWYSTRHGCCLPGSEDMEWLAKCVKALLPDYTQDLNAVRKAEVHLLGLKKHYWQRYVPLLARVIAEEHDPHVRVSVPVNVLISAEASERAEAILRLFNRWEETKP